MTPAIADRVPPDSAGAREIGFADEGSTTRKLQDYVKAKLPPYKYPRQVLFLDELPKTGTGKIDRQALRRM